MNPRLYSYTNNSSITHRPVYSKPSKKGSALPQVNVANVGVAGIQRQPKGASTQLTLSLQGCQKFAPDYEVAPHWNLQQVPSSESLPGQRCRLVLTHERLSRAIPVQLHPIEGTQLFDAVQELHCNWTLDLDGDGQLVDDEARSALDLLLEGFLGGAS